MLTFMEMRPFLKNEPFGKKLPFTGMWSFKTRKTSLLFKREQWRNLKLDETENKKLQNSLC